MVVFRHRSQSQSDSEGSVSSGETLHAQPAPVKCRWSKCGEWFNQLELLASHVTSQHAVPGKGGLFYCQWESCNRTDRGFNARYKMLVHMRTHTNEKPHHCFQCDKSFSRAENLKIHARSHTGERPYVCPVAGCGKAYSNSSDRFKHTRTHSVDKPYMCKVEGCSKRYTDPSSLRKHVKTYRHYPNSSIKVTKMDVEADSWNSDTEKRLSSSNLLTKPRLESSKLSYTLTEESQISPMIATACYDRSTVLVTNHSVMYNDKQSEPIGTTTDMCLPNSSAFIRDSKTPFQNDYTYKSLYNEDSRNRTSPSYADQVRRSMSPPLYIEDLGRTITYETTLTPLTPQPYYLFYGYTETPTYSQEQQDMPLDLSVNH